MKTLSHKPVHSGNQTPVDGDVTLMNELGLLGGEDQNSSKTTDKVSSDIHMIYLKFVCGNSLMVSYNDITEIWEVSYIASKTSKSHYVVIL
ncbi:unnamed protein product [Rhizophagus irregularis]|nr:unnamed protein product [Rhizophagus irregularis]